MKKIATHKGWDLAIGLEWSYWRIRKAKVVEPCSGFTVYQFQVGPLRIDIYG